MFSVPNQNYWKETWHRATYQYMKRFEQTTRVELIKDEIKPGPQDQTIKSLEEVDAHDKRHN